MNLVEVCEHGSLKRQCLTCELQKTINEQARLLGMSGSREVALLARIERLRYGLEIISVYPKTLGGWFLQGLAKAALSKDKPNG